MRSFAGFYWGPLCFNAHFLAMPSRRFASQQGCARASTSSTNIKELLTEILYFL